MDEFAFSEVEIVPGKSFYVVTGDITEETFEAISDFEDFLNGHITIGEITDEESSEILMAALLQYYEEQGLDFADDDSDEDSDEDSEELVDMPATIQSASLVKDRGRTYVLVNMIDLALYDIDAQDFAEESDESGDWD